MKLCFPLMSRTILYFHVYIKLDFPIIYRNASVLCRSECACLQVPVMKIPTQKGEHSCKCTELSLKRENGIKTR